MVAESPIDRIELKSALRHIDLGRHGSNELTSVLPSTAIGVVIYGSRARGDHLEDSDVDALVVVSNPTGSRGGGLGEARSDRRSAAGTRPHGRHVHGGVHPRFAPTDRSTIRDVRSVEPEQ